jgi:hypothetical protein
MRSRWAAHIAVQVVCSRVACDACIVAIFVFLFVPFQMAGTGLIGGANVKGRGQRERGGAKPGVRSHILLEVPRKEELSVWRGVHVRACGLVCVRLRVCGRDVGWV